GLAAEEVEPDGELLLVGADHVLDGDGAVAGLGVGGQVDGPEAAHGEQALDAVAAVQERAGGGRQRRAAALGGALGGRVGDAAGGVGAEVGRPLHVGDAGGLGLDEEAAVHAGDGPGQQVGAAGGALGRGRLGGRGRRRRGGGGGGRRRGGGARH